MSAVMIIRKITVKLVSGKVDIEEVLKSPDKRMDLMTVFGFASKAKPDSSDYGMYVKFSGQFRAVDMRTGEEYSSGTIILPPVAQDLLLGALEHEGAESVQFGFKIGVRYDKEAVTKYVYDVESVVKPSEDDPMERLSLEIKRQALPAPEKTEAAAKPGKAK